MLRPGDAGYEESRKVWNGLIDKRPALIARCAGLTVTDAAGVAPDFSRGKRLEVNHGMLVAEADVHAMVMGELKGMGV